MYLSVWGIIGRLGDIVDQMLKAAYKVKTQLWTKSECNCTMEGQEGNKPSRKWILHKALETSGFVWWVLMCNSI